MDLRGAERIPGLAQDPYPGHQDDLPRPEEGAGPRAVIAYLRTMADTPVPLPDQAAIDAATAAAAAAAPATAEAAAAAPATDAAAATAEPAAAARTRCNADCGSDRPAAAISRPCWRRRIRQPGETVAKKCAACHNFEKGGPNKVGPNLWDIVGAKHAHKDDYSYSDAIKGMADKEWSYADLDAFLTAPKAYAPGTKMTFPGIKKPEDRAAVITYLRSLSDSPKPLP